MKRIVSCFSFALCIILGTAFLAACSVESDWLRPDFSYDGEELTVEFITNREKDFEFPVEGLKLDHSKFESEGLLEYSWVIYNNEHELVGWIEAGGGYETDNKGGYKYGYSAMTSNGVYGYSDTNFLLVLKSKDLAIFDNIEVKGNYGAVPKASGIEKNPIKGSERYTHYDEEINQVLPDAGAESFVCCYYVLNLSGIDPKETRTINITFSLKH